MARVDGSLCRDLERGTPTQHATLADVRTLGVLTDHHEVVRRLTTRRRPDERSLIDEEVEFETHLEQQPPLDDPRWNLRGTDGAEQNAVERSKFVEHPVGEDLTVAQVAGPAEIEVGRGDVDPGGPNDLDRLGGHFRADAVAADHCDVVRHGRRAYDGSGFASQGESGEPREPAGILR